MHYISRLAEEIGTICHTNGLLETAITGLNLYRCDFVIEHHPVLYTPSICLVAQGQKQIQFGDNVRHYDPDNYLISSVPMPIEAAILDVTTHKPYLGISLDVDSYMISELLIDMAPHLHQQSASEEVVVSTAITPALENGMIRLLNCLSNPMDLRILAPTIKREIFYEVLKGPHGTLLKNCVVNHAGTNRIAPAIHYIKENFHTPLDVHTIAGHVGMSPSTLHDHFKRVTAMSPIQFVKHLRLHHAHALLLRGKQATEASYQVGYNSPSQFSREFKRFFGASPSEISLAAEATNSRI